VPTDRSDQYGSALVPVRATGLREAVAGDVHLVLDTQLEKCHVLNASASAVWMAIDGTSNVEAIVERIGSSIPLVSTEPTESTEPADAVERHSQLDASVLVSRTLEELQTIGLVSLEDRTAGVSSSQSTAVPVGIVHDGRWARYVERLFAQRSDTITLGPWSLGTMTLRVLTDVPELAAEIERVFASMPEPDPEPHHRPGERDECVVMITRGLAAGGANIRLYIDGKRIRRGMIRERALDLVMTRLNLLAIDRAREAILLHAGAVELNGTVVVIAGSSGRGKSTLTAALVRSGLGYLTDELVIIEPSTNQVRPYPKALDLAATSLDLLDVPPEGVFPSDKFRVSPSSLGEVSSGGQLSLIVILDESVERPLAESSTDFGHGAGGISGETRPSTPDRSADPDGGRMVELDRLEALAALLPNVFAQTYRDPMSLQHLADLCHDVRVVRLDRQPPAVMVGIIHDLLATVS